MVRHEALTAIAAVGGVSCLPVLKKGLKSGDALDRMVAADTIATFGPRARLVVADLIQAAEDHRGIMVAQARGAAIKALAKIGRDARAAVPALKRIRAEKKEDWNAWLTEAAEEALSKIEVSGQPPAASQSRVLRRPCGRWWPARSRCPSRCRFFN